MKSLKKTSIFLLFAALLLTVTLSASSGEPNIAFSTKSHDFGNIAEEGGAVSCNFEFVNTGDAPLVIISATASCGCTRPKFPSEPIKPGKTGKITVTYLPAGRPGEFDKTVTIRTNVKKQKKIRLKVSGVVVPKAK